MAIAERELQQKSKILTYDDYLNGGETPGHYEIVDGVRHWMTATHDLHQGIVGNIAYGFKTYAIITKKAKVFTTPVDILTRMFPLQVRQPDVLLISNERYGNRSLLEKTPWKTGPELVVEVLSTSDRKRFIRKKLLEYASVNVLEAWLMHPELRKIEQWQLSTFAEPQLLGMYIEGQKLTSTSFPGLAIDLTGVFEF